MIKSYLYLFLVVVLYYFMATSCANQIALTGGPKDTIPPVLINSVPLNQSLDYNDQSIFLEFDERIKTDNIKDQLIITPLTEAEYEYTLKKNTIKLTFDQPFIDSTTYTFNFRESIQDITESNPTKDNKLTFSTGDYIDSMSIEGYVKELLTYDTLEEVIVGLYRSNDTVTIFNGSPYYFTEVNEEGYYLIENIKNGNYLLYAFKDENKNLELETNKELYAFAKDTIALDTGRTQKNLDLIHLDLSEFKMMTAISSGKYFEINFNKYLVDYQINPIQNEHQFLTNKSKENKSIRFYNNFNEEDSLQISFTAVDSINNVIQDTVYVKFTESRRNPDEFTMAIKPKNNSSIQTKLQAELTFNKPIISYTLDSFFIQYDTTIITSISDSTFQWSKFKDQLIFETEIDKTLIDTIEIRKQRMAEALKDSVINNQANSDEKRQIDSKEKRDKPRLNQGLQLYMGKGTFISADKDTSKVYAFNYKIIEPSDYGTQDIKVESEYNGYTIQLLSEKFEIIDEISNEKEFSFKFIEPGNYRIRVLIDQNDDGKWSPGNMIEQIEPEPVYIYPEVLVIRADWQTSLTLSF